jgi:kynurenine formamidase
MNAVDLSHVIANGMPVFPGDQLPAINTVATIDEDGYNGHRMTLSSHTGTHVDAPIHILPHQPALEAIAADTFIGKGAVVDVTACQETGIDVSHLRAVEPSFASSDFVLLRTGWSRFWGQERYFGGYPVLSREAARWIGGFPLKGLGVDAPSVDVVDSSDLPIHKILLRRFILIENLTHLDRLPPTGFTFCCFPLKLEGGDASPVRAVALT